MASTEVFNRKEAIKHGWEQAKKNIFFFVKVLVIVIAVYLVLGMIQGMFTDPETKSSPLLLSILSGILQMLLGLGLVRITLDVVDNKKFSLSDIYSQYKYLPNAVAAGVLSTLAIVAGLLLLFIPGIIISIKLQFVNYFILDKGMGPIEAMKASWNATKGVKWALFVLGILLGLINLLGLLALVIGLFWTYPATLIATAYVYRKLSAKGGAAGAVAAKTQEPPLVIPSSQAPKATSQ